MSNAGKEISLTVGEGDCGIGLINSLIEDTNNSFSFSDHEKTIFPKGLELETGSVIVTDSADYGIRRFVGLIFKKEDNDEMYDCDSYISSKTKLSNMPTWFDLSYEENFSLGHIDDAIFPARYVEITFYGKSSINEVGKMTLYDPNNQAVMLFFVSNGVDEIKYKIFDYTSNSK